MIRLFLQTLCRVQEFETIFLIKVKHILLIVSINNYETATSLVVWQ